MCQLVVAQVVGGFQFEAQAFWCSPFVVLTFSEKFELALGEKRWNDGDDTAYPQLEKILVHT